MRRLIIPLLAVLLAGTGCIQAGATPDRIVAQQLNRTEQQPHRFEYREATDDRVFVVRGAIEDDLRRSATLSIDGQEALEVRMSDDAIAMRIVDPEAFPPPPLEDQGAVRALLEGRWVIDYMAAPPLVAPVTREGSVVVGENPVLDAWYAFQYVKRAVNDAAAVVEHNPDEVGYFPQDDAFVELTEELDRGSGYRRFRAIAPPLPGRAARGTEEAVPETPHFRHLSLFMRGDRLVKIVEEINWQRTEFRRAQEGREAEHYLNILRAAMAGETREPIRLRSMSYTIEELGRAQTVELPTENVVAGHLGELFRMTGHTPTGPPEEPFQAPGEGPEEAPTDT